MYRRKTCFRICKHQFLLSLSHLSLSRMWQRLFFFRFNILIKCILFYFFNKVVRIHLLQNETTSCNIIKLVAIVTSECIYLFKFENLTHFSIIRFLIRFRCFKSRFKYIRLFAIWFSIIEVFSRDRFFIIIFIFIFYISKLDVHITKNLIDKLT